MKLTTSLIVIFVTGVFLICCESEQDSAYAERSKQNIEETKRIIEKYNAVPLFDVEQIVMFNSIIDTMSLFSAEIQRIAITQKLAIKGKLRDVFMSDSLHLKCVIESSISDRDYFFLLDVPKIYEINSFRSDDPLFTIFNTGVFIIDLNPKIRAEVDFRNNKSIDDYEYSSLRIYPVVVMEGIIVDHFLPSL